MTTFQPQAQRNIVSYLGQSASAVYCWPSYTTGIYRSRLVTDASSQTAGCNPFGL